MNRDFPHASKSFRQLNPHLFGAVGAVETAVHPQPKGALDGRAPKKKSGAPCVAVRVVLTAHLARAMDSDNLAASLKPLQDAVAESLGLDDRDIRWSYQQVEDSHEGVCVKVCV